MKDQFVSVVSHELRTPLTSMVGYLELVLEGEAGELTDEQQQFLADRRPQLRPPQRPRRRDSLRGARRRRQVHARVRIGRPDRARRGGGDVRAGCRPSAKASRSASRSRTSFRRSGPTRRASPRCSTTCSRTQSSSRRRAAPSGRPCLAAGTPLSVEVADTGRRHPRGRGRESLRAVLPRLDGRHDPGHRPRAVDREIDRRSPRRDNLRRERRRRGHDLPSSTCP